MNEKRFFYFTSIFILFIGISVVSCKKKDNSVNFHFDYFPQSQGKFVVYDVMEISHSTGVSGSDTSIYQLKTVIGEVYTDNEGRTARKFYRYKRISPLQTWSLEDVWTSIIADYRAELVEENQRVVKLVFAPTISKEWDANANNTLGNFPCYYDEIHKPYSLGSLSFDSTLIVEQADDINAIEYKRKYEVYAKGVGMIKKHFQDLVISNFNVTDITAGKELFMDVIDFGTE